MTESVWLAERFEQHRSRLHAVAYQMLGSLPEAEDAVQDTWLRLDRTGHEEIDNLGGWLTTVVARECLHRLRSRRRRRERLVDTTVDPLPDPIVTADTDPEREALLADSVGLALLVVLDVLSPTERVAFVLHDLFDLPYDEIAVLVQRSPAATRQLASRARRRVRGADLVAPDRDPRRQREVVEAFYAAVEHGDFASLAEILAPEVVFRADLGAGRGAAVYRGAAEVARRARAARGADLQPVLVNDLPGVITRRRGEPVSIMAFVVVSDRIVEIYGIRDPDRVRRLTTAIAPDQR